MLFPKKIKDKNWKIDLLIHTFTFIESLKNSQISLYSVRYSNDDFIEAPIEKRIPIDIKSLKCRYVKDIRVIDLIPEIDLKFNFDRDCNVKGAFLIKNNGDKLFLSEFDINQYVSQCDNLNVSIK